MATGKSYFLQMNEQGGNPAGTRHLRGEGVALMDWAPQGEVPDSFRPFPGIGKPVCRRKRKRQTPNNISAGGAGNGYFLDVEAVAGSSPAQSLR